jgi:ferredoxin
MKKAHVKKDACIGCGLCTSIASEVFAFGNDGLAENVLGDNTEIPEEVQANVQEAADSCPTSAIETE